ncbi:HEPN domain-containing protein [Pedobacter sp. SD-b]|uniref:HEPN domain-containing protein n=1 Tax=Pedobacter segetis TaxID=2793069 RepID=A0ABS1BGH6_9SPHI|nr:HEPN domain-containing protein [Pedobacter segetis]MBK0381965.1 HEPN domain-containing protein [Pedobacter segetis]
MQSFRTELENPIVEKEIIDLERKIKAFREGKIHDEKFRSLRLARGIYGQRQPGVQMVRIKIPFGKVTFKQLLKIADVSDEYASSNLHFTTRQDIQIHYVSLDRTPELWAKLAEDEVTTREACGNTVRNVTSSATAGIDPNEPFDVSPYAQGFFKYFLRNPICQEMGRKFKFGFSASDEDSAYSFINDIGFIPKVKIENGKEARGFKVVLGGSLGAQPYIGQMVYEFLHEDLIIPFAESVLRVFDRHGERTNRNKARLKFLLNKVGFNEFLEMAKQELVAGKVKTFKIDRNTVDTPKIPDALIEEAKIPVSKQLAYEVWLATNVFEQKQKGFYGVFIKAKTGDMPTATARKFVKAVSHLVGDEMRVTINQGLLLKYARKENLTALYLALDELGLSEAGHNSVADVTTCPGTDTCNLGISNSMELSRVLEAVIYAEYAEFVHNKEIKIKISGCMNSCGQHGIAQIGFHGSSMKVNGKIMPTVQVLLGGGSTGNGEGRAADKIIKVPSKRAPQVLRTVLDDYIEKQSFYTSFLNYYDELGKDYFYQLLKPLADQENVIDDEFIDWGQREEFVRAIGVGECAGVMIDLVATLIFETEEKYGWALEAFENKAYADAIYNAYNTMISGAKALLLDKGINQSTQIGVINAFDQHFASEFNIKSFSDLVLQINKTEPSLAFAEAYLAETKDFLTKVKAFRPNPELV